MEKYHEFRESGEFKEFEEEEGGKGAFLPHYKNHMNPLLRAFGHFSYSYVIGCNIASLFINVTIAVTVVLSVSKKFHYNQMTGRDAMLALTLGIPSVVFLHADLLESAMLIFGFIVCVKKGPPLVFLGINIAATLFSIPLSALHVVLYCFFASTFAVVLIDLFHLVHYIIIYSIAIVVLIVAAVLFVGSTASSVLMAAVSIIHFRIKRRSYVVCGKPVVRFSDLLLFNPILITLTLILALAAVFAIFIAIAINLALFLLSIYDVYII